MGTLQKIKNWFSKNWMWVVSGVAALSALSAIIFSFGRKSGVSILTPTNDISEDVEEISRMEGYKEALSESNASLHDDIEKVDDVIEKVEATIESETSKVSSMTPDQKLDKFTELGY